MHPSLNDPFVSPVRPIPVNGTTASGIVSGIVSGTAFTDMSMAIYDPGSLWSAPKFEIPKPKPVPLSDLVSNTQKDDGERIREWL